VLGNAIERTSTREESLEIMVQMRNGDRRAIVQAKGAESFNPGDAVIIVSTGSKVRVSRAPVVSMPGAAPAALPAPVPGTRS
jgi:outer membrane lipoprotein SlyB